MKAEWTNVESSLAAVEEALTHLTRSLEQAGFAEGTNAYRKMTDIVMGQWFWGDSIGAKALEPRFGRIAGLAGTIVGYLTPYVDLMSRLAAIRGLLWERWAIEPESAAGKILTALMDSGAPMAVDELRWATNITNSAVRREIRNLIANAMVADVGGRPSRFVLLAMNAE